MQKFLVAGLGNPGEDYKNSRHNIGFKILDSISMKYRFSFETLKKGELAEIKIKGKQIFFLKPSTYMNLSGKAVNYYMLKKNIPIHNLLIVTDDLHLDFGRIKIKTKGRDGGHNGHKSIIETLRSSEYARLKFGIGDLFKQGDQSKYVLSKWSNQELLDLSGCIDKATNAIISFCVDGPKQTMNNFN